MIIDIFELPPIDDEMMRDLAEIEMVRATARRKEALQLFYTLSRDFRDAFSDLDLVVLKPLCTSCANQRSIGLGSSEKTTIVMVLPGYRPKQFRMYDRSSHLLHFFPFERTRMRSGSGSRARIAATMPTREMRMGTNSSR